MRVCVLNLRSPGRHCDLFFWIVNLSKGSNGRYDRKMGKSMKISAIIITRNEEARIAKCLSSVDWADEVIVVDNGSTDATRDVANKKGAVVISAGDTRDFAGLRNRGKTMLRASGSYTLMPMKWSRMSLQKKLKKSSVVSRQSSVATNCGEKLLFRSRMARCRVYFKINAQRRAYRVVRRTSRDGTHYGRNRKIKCSTAARYASVGGRNGHQNK